MDTYFIKIEINNNFIIVREKAFDVDVSCSFKILNQPTLDGLYCNQL